VAGVIVSAVWNQVVLRRFAKEVHTAVRQRLAIVHAFRDVQLGDAAKARVVLDGAWLLATCDGELDHQEALALSTLIDSLQLPGMIAVEDASFTDDEEGWFDRVVGLEPGSRAVLIDVLALIASADGELTIPERRFFKRLSRALGTAIDIPAIERMVERMRDGEAPGDFAASVVPALNTALAPA
jgi:tellurite resistance protein